MSVRRVEAAFRSDATDAWYGQLPARWSTSRLGHLYTESVARAASAKEKEMPVLSVSIHHGVSNKELGEEELDRKVSRSVDRSLYKVVRTNDIVYNMMRAWQGGIGATSVDGLVSPAYVVCRPRHGLDSSFFEYVLASGPCVAEMRRYSRGITDFRLRLYWEDFKSISVPVPPKAERATIRRFLDHETAKIDELIEKQQQLIALLEEKRQAVISHAVTKGVNTDAPIGNAPLTALGSVPAHWRVAPLSVVAAYQEGPGIMASEFKNAGVPLIRVAGLQGEEVTLNGCNYLRPGTVKARWEHFRLVQGDLLVSASASIGAVAQVGEEAEGAIPYTGLIRIRPRTEALDIGFLRLFLMSRTFLGQVDELKAGSTIQHYGPTHLRQVKLPLPSIKEQRSIADHVHATVCDVDELIERARQFTLIVRERRAALISAAVTGTIDVRDWKAPESNTTAAEATVA